MNPEPPDEYQEAAERYKLLCRRYKTRPEYKPDGRLDIFGGHSAGLEILEMREEVQQHEDRKNKV